MLAVYTTRIEAEKAEAPVLLANGNLVAAGDWPAPAATSRSGMTPSRSRATCSPWWAAVLPSIEDRFVTMSGRAVALRIYVEHGKQDRCDYAMDSLKRAMRWDEQRFGREYDLDVFMIVAVSDLNMGAMENKGLNIFNDKYVLASPATATDADFAGIETVIAHEYFHNWTGDRITCRDWFQLCLKEGLTVFRDQEFTSDERSRPVKRIADVRALRAQQFVEDAGPLAHPVRPRRYHEINNFYTATVYKKGAEIVRMLSVLLGPDGFRPRHGPLLRAPRRPGRDGRGFSAVLRRRERARPGAVHAVVRAGWHAAGGGERPVGRGHRTYRLDLAQTTPPTPGQPHKDPFAIPLVIGLHRPTAAILRSSAPTAARSSVACGIGRALAKRTFADVPASPGGLARARLFGADQAHIGAVGRGLRFQAAHDSDPFNRWQALQTLATALLVDNTAAARAGAPLRSDQGLIEALAAILDDRALEPAFAAQAIVLPSEADIAREIGRDVDPDAIFKARSALRAALGRALGDRLRATYERLTERGPYSPDAVSAGRRALRNACLDLIAATGEPASIGLAARQSRAPTR